MKDISIVLLIPGGDALRWKKKGNKVFTVISDAISLTIRNRTARIIFAGIGFSIENNRQLFAQGGSFSTFLIVEFWETNYNLDDQQKHWQAIEKYLSFGAFPQVLEISLDYQIFRLDYFDAVY